MSNEVRISASTNARLLRRSFESLLGIAAGLVADGALNDQEVLFLSTWLSDNSELGGSWPGEVVLKRVREVLADGVISEEERQYLLETLTQLVGGSFSNDGAVPTTSSQLPLDHGVVMRVPDASFCFTGKFLFGTRASCERAVESRGGRIANIQRTLDYLVIGELSSRDWKYSAFGTKIESAMRLKADGNPLCIVSEAQWVAAL